MNLVYVQGDSNYHHHHHIRLFKVVKRNHTHNSSPVNTSSIV